MEVFLLDFFAGTFCFTFAVQKNKSGSITRSNKN